MKKNMFKPAVGIVLLLAGVAIGVGIMLLLPLGESEYINSSRGEYGNEMENLPQAMPVVNDSEPNFIGASSVMTWGPILENVSVERAEALLPFSVALPSVLPDSAVFSGVTVSGWGGEDITNVETKFDIKESRDVIGHITLAKGNGEWVGSYFVDGDFKLALDRWYNHISYFISGNQTIRTSVGDFSAVLTATDLDTLQGITEPAYCGYYISWTLFWHDGFHDYTLSGRSTVEHIDYRMLIDIAESVG